MRAFRAEHSVDAKPRPQPSRTDMPRGGRAATEKRPAVDRPTTSRVALARQVDLPRTDERSPVEFQGHEYHLCAYEVQVLANLGAFRVVDTQDLPGDQQRWHGDLEELRRQGLVAIRAQQGDRSAFATPTTAGRELPDGHQRTEPGEARQAYYVKPREGSTTRSSIAPTPRPPTGWRAPVPASRASCWTSNKSATVPAGRQSR